MLPNIARSKANQAMTLGQLIEYNIRNIFIEKSNANCGGETRPRPFSEKLKLSISWDQYFQVLHSLFLFYGKLRLSKYIETKLQTTWFYLI